MPYIHCTFPIMLEGHKQNNHNSSGMPEIHFTFKVMLEGHKHNNHYYGHMPYCSVPTSFASCCCTHTGKVDVVATNAAILERVRLRICLCVEKA